MAYKTGPGLTFIRKHPALSSVTVDEVAVPVALEKEGFITLNTLYANMSTFDVVLVASKCRISCPLLLLYTTVW